MPTLSMIAALLTAQRGEIDKAIADYTHAIELNPRYAAAYNSRSKAFAAKGELDRADADHKKAVEIGLP
jgi:tetratricopeptide (TPR) repeat protein